jgi:hypothetical protein
MKYKQGKFEENIGLKKATSSTERGVNPLLEKRRRLSCRPIPAWPVPVPSCRICALPNAALIHQQCNSISINLTNTCKTIY